MRQANIQATPIPLVTYILLGVIFSDALNQMLVFPYVPFLVRAQLDLSADDPEVPLRAGLLAAAYLFGQFLCSPFYGSLSERVGRRPVLLACVACSTGFLIAFGFSEDYMLSIVLRFLQGSTAGALTVGKLYLAEISDSTNEGRVFSYIGIAMGAGCIAGPALGGYLADPSMLTRFPPDSAADALVHAYPYLPPCLAGAVLSSLVLLIAILFLKESRIPPPPIPPPKPKGRLHSLGSESNMVVNMNCTPLLGQQSPSAATNLPVHVPIVGKPSSSTRSSGSGGGSPFSASPPSAGGSGGPMLLRNSKSMGPTWGSSGQLAPLIGENGGAPPPPMLPRNGNSIGFLEEAMSSHASRTSLILEDESGNGLTKLDGSPGPVSAGSVMLKYATSPKAERPAMFGPTMTRSKSLSHSPSPLAVPTTVVEMELMPSSQRRSVFIVVQIASLLFNTTNVGLTDVLPVWLSSSPDGDSGGLGIGPAQIGNLQSSTGIASIVLALFVTYRIINALGPVNTFALSLLVNAAAGVAPAAYGLIRPVCPPELATAIMCGAYALVAASRNMMFATAIMLSKESASGAPGVAIGINQSACSLGSALGPSFSGLLYTQSLYKLHSAAPFFVLLSVLGAAPGVATLQVAPRWPWRVVEMPNP